MYTNTTYNGSTLAPVNLAAGIIKASQKDVVKKYKRKNCPVCKGTGKYVTGDSIELVDCGYCEEDSESKKQTNEILPPAKKIYYK